MAPFAVTVTTMSRSARGLGISLGERLARLDIVGDEPLLTSIQLHAFRGQVVADLPVALCQQRRQGH